MKIHLQIGVKHGPCCQQVPQFHYYATTRARLRYNKLIKQIKRPASAI